jgi:zinc transport system substrate-binding protein
MKNASKGFLALCFLLAMLATPQHSAFAADHATVRSGIHYGATIQPLAAILTEMTRGRGEVMRLLSPGSSPHTFDPRPSDAVMMERAKALFYAGPGLDKEWIDRMPATLKIEMLKLVPAEYLQPMNAHDHGHGHGQEANRHRHGEEKFDPHFWTDPLTVKAMLPALREELSRLDPEGQPVYQRNEARFAAELVELHHRTAAILEPVKGRAVLLFHPSFQYLLNRYGLEMAGTIEPFPGREPSPKALHELIKKVKRLGIGAVFTEPQLSRRPAQVIAEAAGLELYELDPIGGGEGRATYEELILYNAHTLATALR